VYKRILKKDENSARIAGRMGLSDGPLRQRDVKPIWMPLLWLSLPAIAAAQQIAVGESPIPTAHSYPQGITAGLDGALWFTEFNKIGCITTAGVITEHRIPTALSSPGGITAGPDGALWFTEDIGDKIGRITTAGVITEYPIPTASASPEGITAGPDGALWFTEIGDKIARITTAGVITEYPIPTASASPERITAGPDGALWFTEYLGNQIGRITTAGVITEYPIPTASARPEGITAGPDGALWFTEFESNKIGEAVFVTAGLSVSPASGFLRTPLTFTGSTFASNENVLIYAYAIGSGVLASATTDASGSFTATARAPLSVYGPRLFLGVGQSSGKLGAANFSVTPRLSLNPNSGTVGSTVNLQGVGFGSFETINIYWNNPRTYLGSAPANYLGTFNATFTVPTGAALGTNTVFGKGTSTVAVGAGHFNVQ